MVDIYGGIEAGGTKFICAVGKDPDHVLAETRISTTTPEDTIGEVIQFFEQEGQSVKAIGVGSFGPLDPDPESSTFGTITSTPKPGWASIDVVQPLKDAFRVPVGFDTDVNAAALGEYRWGAGQGLHSLIYLTVGTGIGGGVVLRGNPLHGVMHPEMGHIRIPHDLERDPFPGVCPYHSDCLEGLASGPAIEARWDMKPEELSEDHPAWALEAHYLALGLVNYVLTLSPQRMILGGGVMRQLHLFPIIRGAVRALLSGYMEIPELKEGIDAYIVPPALGNRAGVLGAFELARRVYER